MAAYSLFIRQVANAITQATSVRLIQDEQWPAILKRLQEGRPTPELAGCHIEKDGDIFVVSVPIANRKVHLFELELDPKHCKYGIAHDVFTLSLDASQQDQILKTRARSTAFVMIQTAIREGNSPDIVLSVTERQLRALRLHCPSLVEV